MAARLTDLMRKKIVADYLDTGSLRATARNFSISDRTVKRVVDDCGDIERLAAQKKAENDLAMQAFMEDRKAKMQAAIDLHIKALTDPDKIADASLSQVATSFGILVDKATRNTAGGNDSLHKVDALLAEFKNAVKSETG